MIEHNDKTLELIERLREVGIGDSELEALAEGNAWVCEWVNYDANTAFKSTSRALVNSFYGWDVVNLGYEGEDLYTNEGQLWKEGYGEPELMLTFNGSTTLPTPKEEE